MERKTKILAFGGLLVFIFLLVELSCFIFFFIFQDRFSFFDLESMLLEEEKLERARLVYDFELGWKKKFPTPFGERFREKDYGKPLIAIFGDSYTYCDQVRFNQTFQTY